MAKTNYKSIDHYINAFPDEIQIILTSVRKAVKEIIPEAEEVISYQIPAFKLNGKIVIYFAAWTNHISVYPKPGSNEALNKQLAKFKGGKGTVQFPLDKQIPLSLVKKIVKYRLKEIHKKPISKKK